MTSAHSEYHFSITVQTGDAAVLHCLRGLCQQWAGGRYPQMGWGGTDRETWKSNEGRVVLRFTSVAGRASFAADAKRLLGGHWSEVERRDDNPAAPRRN